MTHSLRPPDVNTPADARAHAHRVMDVVVCFSRLGLLRLGLFNWVVVDVRAFSCRWLFVFCFFFFFLRVG